MGFFYTKAIDRIASGQINLYTADIRCILIGTNSSALAADSQAEFLGALTTLDEITALRIGIPSPRTSDIDYAGGCINFKTGGAILDYGVLPSGLQIAGQLFYEHLGADDGGNALLYCSPVPKVTDAQKVIITEPTEGWFQLLATAPKPTA